MIQQRIAARYVKSLLRLAEEQEKLDTIFEDMNVINTVCNESQDFRNLLKTPDVTHVKKRTILTKIFAHKVNSLTMAILDILTRKNREFLLPYIARGFHDAYNQAKGIQKATLKTAIQVDDTIKEKIQSVIKQYSNKEHVELVNQLDENLIGGFVLTIEDKRVDASLTNHLKRLKYQLIGE